MSWITRIDSQITITTGDGRQYNPLWKPTGKSLEFNVTVFDFPDVSGSLVKRKAPKGVSYPVEFYFQGEFHLDASKQFEESAKDVRPWTISHPYYDSILVQPTTLRFEHDQYNVTKITGTLIETIVDENPKGSVDASDKIISDAEDCNDECAEAFADNVIATTSDKAQLTANTNASFQLGKTQIKLGETFNDYFNAFNAANTAITNATAEPLAAIRAIQAVIMAPYQFQDSVNARITLLTDQFNALRRSIATATTPNKKRIYQSHGATVMAAIAATTATPQDGDYSTRARVMNTAATVTELYDQFLTDLDTLQNANIIDNTDYAPDARLMRLVSDLIDYTVSNLFTIAMTAKQERSLILESDSNVIQIAHRLYGLKADDSTIDQVISENGIGLNEIIQIKKGRTILWYV